MTIDSQGGGSEWLIRGNPTKAVHESERLKSRHKDTQRIHVLIHVTNLVPRDRDLLSQHQEIEASISYTGYPIDACSMRAMKRKARCSGASF